MKSVGLPLAAVALATLLILPVAASQGGAPDGTEDVIVLLEPMPQLSSTSNEDPVSGMKAQSLAGERAIDRFLRQRGDGRIEERYWVTNGIRVNASPATIEALKRRPDVKAVLPNAQMTTLGNASPTAPTTWGLDTIGAPGAWNRSITGEGVTVAVVDTGVDYTHPDLDQNIWTNTDEVPDNGVDDDGNGYVDDYRGWDFGDEDDDPMDSDGHGTHVAGTVAGYNDGGGTQTGVAPDAQIMVLKVEDSNGSISFSSMISAVQYAVDNGADVVSMSIGTTCATSQSTVRSFTESYTFVEDATAAGVTVVISAGNCGSGSQTISFPGSEGQAITAGATDSNDAVASFSSRGPVVLSSETYTKPDVSAPGVGVRSTKLGGGYTSATWNGTSMAAPHISGLVALLLESNTSLAPADLKTLLRDTSLDVAGAGPENDSGWGRIRADRAIYAAAPYPRVTNLSLSPSPAESNVTVNATADAWFSTVASAEISIDSAATPGTGTPMNASDGTYDSSSENLTVTLNLSGRSEGNHSLYLRAQDAGGNWSTTFTTNFSIDRSPPVFNGNNTHLPTNQTRVKQGDTLTVEVDVTDTALSTVSVNATPLNASLGNLSLSRNVSTGNWTKTIVAGAVPSGTCSLTISATDSLGKTNTTNVTVSVDNDAPIATLTSPTEGATLSGTHSITGIANDTTSLASWSLEYGNGSGWTAINSSNSSVNGTLGTWNTANTSDGSYQLRLTAIDGASSTNTSVVNVTVDNHGPIITSSAVPYPGNHSWARDGQTVTLTVSVTDPGSGVRNVTVNASAVNQTGALDLSRLSGNWTLNLTLDAGANGTYSLPIAAYDNASHLNDTESLTLRIDNDDSAGVTNLSATGATEDESGRYVVNWTASSDPTSGIASYRVYTSNRSFTDVENASLNATSGNATTSLTLNGTLNKTAWIAVTPVDLAGNENTSVIPVNVTPLDDRAPRIANATPANGSRTTDHTPTISADFVDVSGVDNASTTIQLDGTNITANAVTDASGFTYTTGSLSDGTYTVTVHLVDARGNAANHTWSFEVYTEDNDDDDSDGDSSGGGSSGSSSGGGGGGGASSPSEDPDNIRERYVDYIWSIQRGERQRLDLTADESDVIREIGFVYDSFADDVKVEVQELNGPTTLREQEPPGTVYHHFNLYVNLPLETPLKHPELRLTVDRDWFESRGGDPSRLKLARWNTDQEQWNLIDLERVEEDGDEVVFIALPPGFSQYAVTYVESDTDDAESNLVTTENRTPSPEIAPTSTPLQEKALEPTPTPTVTPAPGFALALLALTLALRVRKSI